MSLNFDFNKIQLTPADDGSDEGGLRGSECYTPLMYAQKFRVELVVNEQRQAAPLDWLDAFCMRNFTGSAEFDDTLPVADGEIEASLKVNPERFAAAFGEWLKKRGKAGGEQTFRVEVRPLEMDASKEKPAAL